jgi:translation initiation factor 1
MRDSRTVYTTESGRICPDCGQPSAGCICRNKPSHTQGDGVVRIRIERKGRGGKVVTSISGLPGDEKTLRTLAKELKQKCGSGGAVKEGVVEIQGNHRDMLVELLRKRGLVVKAAGG